MLPLDYVLAAALLTAPPDAADAPGAADTYAALCPLMQQIALRWEVLDPREVRPGDLHGADRPVSDQLGQHAGGNGGEQALGHRGHDARALRARVGGGRHARQGRGRVFRPCDRLL